MADTGSRLAHIIERLKAPILDSTDNVMVNNSSGQDVGEVLTKVGGRLDEIYDSIVSVINNGENQHGGVKNDTVEVINTLLEQHGIISDLRKDPKLKEQLLKIVILLLKEYPYTRTAEHVNKLNKMHTEVEKTIVPNKS